jgi:Holliday junction resolvase RusA-like endonuclease
VTPVGDEGGRKEWRFVIPVLPPSVNSLHQIIYPQRKVVLKPEILKWRSDIACYVPRISLVAESLVEVGLVFHYPYLYQNGRLRRFDTHNMVKVLLDVISWKANFDDSRVKSGSWASVDSDDEKVEVHLRELS